MKKTLTIPYQNQELEFDVWMSSLEAWLWKLLGDTYIFSNIQWDAQRKYIYNGATFVWMIDEPWTADAWWNLQVCVLLSKHSLKH